VSPPVDEIRATTASLLIAKLADGTPSPAPFMNMAGFSAPSTSADTSLTKNSDGESGGS
jgi:hypothetical protein